MTLVDNLSIIFPCGFRRSSFFLLSCSASSSPRHSRGSLRGDGRPPARAPGRNGGCSTSATQRYLPCPPTAICPASTYACTRDFRTVRSQELTQRSSPLHLPYSHIEPNVRHRPDPPYRYGQPKSRFFLRCYKPRTHAHLHGNRPLGRPGPTDNFCSGMRTCFLRTRSYARAEAAFANWHGHLQQRKRLRLRIRHPRNQ